MTAEDGAAAERLRAAVAAEPFLVAGTGRFDTDVMDITGTRAFVKTGAEGVYTAALPALGLGVALKVDDGASRASEVAMAAVLDQLLPDIDLAPFVEPQVRWWRGVPVGRLRPGPALPPLRVAAPGRLVVAEGHRWGGPVRRGEREGSRRAVPGWVGPSTVSMSWRRSCGVSGSGCQSRR